MTAQISSTFDRRREEFPTLASGIHLLSHSLGPVPRAAREAMLAYTDAWERHTSEDAWATSWWELSERVGDRIARLLGGASGSVQVKHEATTDKATDVFGCTCTEPLAPPSRRAIRSPTLSESSHQLVAQASSLVCRSQASV